MRHCGWKSKRKTSCVLHCTICKKLPPTSCLCVCVYASTLSCVQLFKTPWTIAYWAPLSMESSRQEYWGGLPYPTPGYLPDPGIEPASLVSPSLAGGFFATGPPGKQVKYFHKVVKFSLCCVWEWRHCQWFIMDSEDRIVISYSLRFRNAHSLEILL